MVVTISQEEGLQKIDVKIPLVVRAGVDSDPLLVVFGRWRLEEGEEIVDVADYGHVPEGPGVILISHRWHFGIDWGGEGPGLRLSSRKGLKGSPEARFAAVIRTCMEKSRRLLGEIELAGRAKPRLDEIEIVLNDRLLAPNTVEGDANWRPGLLKALDRLYGKDGYTVEREQDPGRRLGYRVKARSADNLVLSGLISRLRGLT